MNYANASGIAGIATDATITYDYTHFAPSVPGLSPLLGAAGAWHGSRRQKRARRQPISALRRLSFWRHRVEDSETLFPEASILGHGNPELKFNSSAILGPRGLRLWAGWEGSG
jgi:hypothetical protein